MAPIPTDPNFAILKKSLVRAAFINGPDEIKRLREVIRLLAQGQIDGALQTAGEATLFFHYRLWAETGPRLGIHSLMESFQRLARNPSILNDLKEILDWSEEETVAGGIRPELPFACLLELHAHYGFKDIKVALGMADFTSAGVPGVGVLHFPDTKVYALLITFQKTEKEFSPSTMYADYPISRELLHWESQSQTSQQSMTGLNLVNHRARGYTILIFARSQKKRNNCTVPFTYLGPAERVSYESERPIKMVWRLRYPMPVDMFEENRRGG